MSERRKQTARKTTGKHTAWNVLVPSGASNPRSKPKRVQNRTCGGPSSTDSKPKPVLVKRSTTATASSPALPPSTIPSPSSLDIPLSALKVGLPVNGNAGATTSASASSGALIRRRPAVGCLDKPISVCTQFATWLENQQCVDGDVLLRAVEREGRSFLSLARATIMLDLALRGHVPPVTNGTADLLSMYARTLRAFADLLKLKISEDDLSEELEKAVLRDGEALLRLALCCLDFDQAVRDSGEHIE